MNDKKYNHNDFKEKIEVIVQKAIDENNISENLYLIFDIDTKSFSIGRMEAPPTTNQQGFEICRLLEPVNGSSFKINSNAIDIVASILEYHE
ncbi:MAG: hypothetical protein J1F42_14595 [Lachnospiraceae bacterium]|nr:hypothetical protein [Muribaculaceae bacterium]MCH5264132.1 hypothetical protein [Lachnospiraceae bacterium]